MKNHSISIPLFLAAASLSFSTPVLAGGIDEVAVLVPEIVIPKLPGGFFVGGTGYYLQWSASAQDLDYASVNPAAAVTFFDPNTSSLAAVQSSQVGHVLPNYTWGWGVFAGYTFPGTGNDIEVNYFHFQGSKEDDSSVVAINTFPVGDPLQVTSDVLPSVITSGTPYPTEAEGHVAYYVNQADFTVGQFIDVGARLRVHPNVGLRWATVHRDVSATFVSPAITNAQGLFPFEMLQTTNTNSHYSGLGPIVGLDASYDLWYGFAGVAHVDAALLAGKIHTELSSNFEVLGEPGVNPLQARQFGYSARSSDIRRLVPVVDAKLGLNYLYQFQDGCALTAEVGWSLSHYFEVVDGLKADNSEIVSSLLPSNAGAPTFTNFLPPATITDHHTVDVGLQGLYFDVAFTM